MDAGAIQPLPAWTGAILFAMTPMSLSPLRRLALAALLGLSVPPAWAAAPLVPAAAPSQPVSPPAATAGAGPAGLTPGFVFAPHRYPPAILRLSRQSLPLPGRSIPLQAGMSLTADIRLRQRRVIHVFTSFFEDQRRNLERLR